MNTLSDTLIEILEGATIVAMALGLALPLLAFSGLAPSWGVIAAPLALIVAIVASLASAIVEEIASWTRPARVLAAIALLMIVLSAFSASAATADLSPRQEAATELAIREWFPDDALERIRFGRVRAVDGRTRVIPFRTSPRIGLRRPFAIVTYGREACILAIFERRQGGYLLHSSRVGNCRE